MVSAPFSSMLCKVGAARELATVSQPNRYVHVDIKESQLSQRAGAMIIDFFRMETSALFRGLAEYHEKMEVQLELIQKKEEEQLRSWAEAEALEPAEFFAELDGHRWTYDFLFPRSLRYSFIVLLFLVLESQLGQLCDQVKNRRNLPVRASEFRGGVVQRAKTYLRKMAGIKDVDWTYVEDLSKIRNCIVHALGKVDLSRDKDRLRHLALRGNGLTISDDEFSEEGILLVSADYCSQAVRNVSAFFDEVFDAAGFGPEIVIL